MTSFELGYWIGIILVLVLGIVIAKYVGAKRYIGFGWSLFFLWTGGLIFGLLVLAFSSKLTEKPKRYFGGQKVTGWILAGFFGIGLLSLIVGLVDRPYIPVDDFGRVGQSIGVAIFLMGLGIYLVQSANFNIRYYSGQVLQQQTGTTYNINTQQLPQPNPFAYNGGHNAPQQQANVNFQNQTNNNLQNSKYQPPQQLTPNPQVKNKEFNDPNQLYGKS
ncbi:hypothetical protein SAMN05443429_103192 [Cruoricaptor ignavus]|uniref:Uncharacterized protein n=1 Tax=Cruoricaptor ignavus TaxID=1118202 RepID=A0A1M6DBZ3_9FLAO|nr:hypothetical protein [Cruoricaptor ignavus]SHI70784.1 hypothetical protein SAMN05443429_103192 [Cruoricaptor ignavus]